MACASGASEEEGLGGREEKRAASKAHATLKESLLSKAQGGHLLCSGSIWGGMELDEAFTRWYGRGICVGHAP